MTFEEWRKEAEQMLMAWYYDDPASVDKDIGDNASIAITDLGKRRVTLPNSSTSAPPRPLRSADGGPLFPTDDLGCETTVAACEPILRALAPPLAGFFLKLSPV